MDHPFHDERGGERGPPGRDDAAPTRSTVPALSRNGGRNGTADPPDDAELERLLTVRLPGLIQETGINVSFESTSAQPFDEGGGTLVTARMQRTPQALRLVLDRLVVAQSGLWLLDVWRTAAREADCRSTQSGTDRTQG